MKNKLNVSICIPAYNEEKNIDILLKKLLVQKTKTVVINNIIVVSSASTDNTDATVIQYAKQDPRVKLLIQKKREGKAAAINAFLKEIKDEIVVIQSADTIPTEDTIENLCSPFLKDPKLGMTGGAPHPVNDPNTLLGFIIHSWWWFHRNIPRFGEIIAYRNVLERISATTAVDEAFIQAKIIQLGYSVVHIDSAVVYNKGPEHVRDLIKQRRRVFNGHARLNAREHIKIDNMTKSSLKLLLFKYKLKNIKQLIWFISGISIEMYARVLGYYDMKFQNKNPFIWDIARSTKQVLRKKKKLVIFLNFAPLDFMGGAEKWMNDTAQKLHKYEDTMIFSVAPNIANIYGRLVLKRRFERRIRKEKLHKHMSLQTNAFIPFTKDWYYVRRKFSNSRVIYTKYELLELLIILYFGGFAALSKTIAGLHSPLIYFSPKTFWDHLHNAVYQSNINIKMLSFMKKVHVLNRRTQEVLTNKFKLKNTTYMPNGIQPVNINYTTDTKKNVLKILFVGELSERKGVDILIEIMKKSHKNFEFTVAGDGYMKKDIQYIADKLSNVRYAGYLSESEVATLYSESDALILPSRAESMPLTVLEAMSHGLTIIDSEECTLGLDREIEHTCDNNKITTYFYALSYLLKQKTEGKLDKQFIKNYFHKNFSSHVIDPKVFKHIFEIMI